MIYVIILAYLATMVWLSVIAAQKGKTTMMICGWLLFTPLIVIAACRIAKPTSKFARENYHGLDPVKSKLSEIRFPKEAFLLKQLEA